ncbi:MAG: histidine phosphatase family protein [Nevskiaceae bacterium]|nr:MAG: histidine phosphatase family protein [Nevskiaceae bacterium]TBR72699.1 MAG: histidine phosphatase family protein [Nevskiaceae bacterium]
MPNDTTTCLLVRHGHVAGITPPRFRGRIEFPLTSLGHRQAEALRDRVAHEWQPAAIYTSALGRCVETGRAIGEPLGRIPQPSEGFLDIDYGQWQGLSHEEVRTRWPDAWMCWRDQPDRAVIPDGETLEAVATRATRALHDILRQHPGKTVVVVAHDSVNRVLLLHALGLPLQRYWSIQQAPCTLNVLTCIENVLAVRTLNETGHTTGL